MNIKTQKERAKNLTYPNDVKDYRIKVAGRLLANGTKSTEAKKKNNLKINITFKV